MPLSEDLLDEIEAVNSIFAPCTPLSHSPSDEDPLIFILTPPLPAPTTSSRITATAGAPAPAVAAPSFRIRFPPAYPTSSSPPEVVGTHSTGGAARRGEAARLLTLLRQAFVTVYREGEVCVYDAIEEFTRLRGGEGPEQDHEDEDEDEAEALGDPPQWTLSDPVTELGSTFLARVARVSSPAQATSFVQHLLATDRRVRQATHNMTAWRIRDPPAAASSSSPATYQDCDDDGEAAAGGRLLRLMQLMNLWGVMVVVTRWYGGHKLGPRRFALINSVARDGFVKAGLAVEGERSGGRKKGGGTV